MAQKNLTPKEEECRDKILNFVHLLVTDMASAKKLMSDDFVWENFLPAHVPFGGRYERASGIEKYIALLAEHWEIGEILFDEVIVSEDGKKFTVIGTEKDGKSLKTGKSCDMDTVWIVRLNDDGRFSYVREYNDTHTMGQTWY